MIFILKIYTVTVRSVEYTSGIKMNTFKNFSLVNFGLLIGIIAGVLAIKSDIYSFFNNPINKLMLGSWSSEYSYPTKYGYNFVKSTDSFFENGKYNIKVLLQ